MLHVYALVRQPAAVPDVLGIEAAPLRSLEAAAGIDAVVSDRAQAAAAPSETAILAHARVVEALTELNEAVLPARFAGEVPDEEDLRRRLHERRNRLLDALERVDGCVELGLRVLPQPSEKRPAASSGSEYMRRRLGDITRAEELAGELHGSLAAAARESTCNVLSRPDVVLTAAYLVARGDLDRFHAALEAVERRTAGVTLVLTGPWPPYSFALLEAGGA
ncbi:MAG: GvpL/GvpF family gas vesicle protein [Gaiellaceae bacterium]